MWCNGYCSYRGYYWCDMVRVVKCIKCSDWVNDLYEYEWYYAGGIGISDISCVSVGWVWDGMDMDICLSYIWFVVFVCICGRGVWDKGGKG